MNLSRARSQVMDDIDGGVEQAYQHIRFRKNDDLGIYDSYFYIGIGYLVNPRAGGQNTS